jgi:amino acid transporter
LLSLSVTVLLSLINVGSTDAFNSIVSLFISSLFSSYFLSIGCVLLKRLRGQGLPPSRWNLGRLAIPLNIVALLYIAFAFIMSFFPLTKEVKPDTMNWSVAVWTCTIVIATLSYYAHGKKHYKGPVVYVNDEFEMPSRRCSRD